jgi:hypothetical protein
MATASSVSSAYLIAVPESPSAVSGFGFTAISREAAIANGSTGNAAVPSSRERGLSFLLRHPEAERLGRRPTHLRFASLRSASISRKSCSRSSPRQLADIAIERVACFPQGRVVNSVQSVVGRHFFGRHF